MWCACAWFLCVVCLCGVCVSVCGVCVCLCSLVSIMNTRSGTDVCFKRKY